MTGEFGLNFAPTGDGRQQQGQSQTPLQDAIKVLSLRIPQFVGAGRGIAPQELLMGGGSAGVPGAGGVPGGLEEFLRRVFGQMGGGQAPTMGPRPAPNVVPGGDIRLPTPGGRNFSPNPMPGVNTGESQAPSLVQSPSIAPSGGGPRPAPVLGGRPFQRMA